MYKFGHKHRGSLTLAALMLGQEDYINGYEVGSDFVEFEFDDYRIRVTSPMEDALQFVLFDLENNNIDSVVTDSVNDALPIRRLIMSLFGTIMLQSFRTEWDGYTITEGNFK